ncbi:MAG: hypothetical protein EG824_13175 [Deltaproteobacteria bacterium]|nr:hypothetical protein [Deltaproteobacteria bacterium]
MRKLNGTECVVFKEADLPLEVVILIIGGMAMLITGAQLFRVSDGTLPYYENGLYGLLLIIFALQVITLGKTPFGDVPRSKPLLAGGVLIAAGGIVTCFIPISLRLPRVLLFLCFGPGGFLLLLQMCFAKDKLRSWARYGGIFRHLILGCSGVYVLSMLIALLLWKRNLLTTPLTAVTVLLFGAAIFYLAAVLRKIYRAYPEADKLPGGDIEISTDQAMLLLMGVFMLLLGGLLVPVSLGVLPFSASAQLGLLMVIFAVQMLASGSTPIGPFPRSWLVIGFGLLFAALGIVSCIIPDILVPALTVLVGVLNILGGVIALAKTWTSRPIRTDEPREPVPPVLTRLFATQLTLNLLAIMFGTSMLIPGLIHGLVIGVVLVTNGCVLLYLLSILVALDRMRGDIRRAT